MKACLVALIVVVMHAVAKLMSLLASLLGGLFRKD